jgi:hypothetical protein
VAKSKLGEQSELAGHDRHFLLAEGMTPSRERRGRERDESGVRASLSHLANAGTGVTRVGDES